MALSNTYIESNKRYEQIPIPETPGYVPPSPPTPPTPGTGSTPDVDRPTFTGTTSVVLYVNNSGSEVVNKDITSVLSDTIDIRESVDLLKPVIMLNTSTDLTGVNYMYMLGRYYYVNCECVQGNLYKITTQKVDTLYTYKDYLLNSSALVRRNSNRYNSYLVDEKVKLNNYDSVKTLEFPSGFNKTLEYLLVAIGG